MGWESVYTEDMISQIFEKLISERNETIELVEGEDYEIINDNEEKSHMDYWKQLIWKDYPKQIAPPSTTNKE